MMSINRDQREFYEYLWCCYETTIGKAEVTYQGKTYNIEFYSHSHNRFGIYVISQPEQDLRTDNTILRYLENNFWTRHFSSWDMVRRKYTKRFREIDYVNNVRMCRIIEEGCNQQRNIILKKVGKVYYITFGLKKS